MKKYSPIVINPGLQTTLSIMIEDNLGEYIKYSDFVKQTETLRDYNFKLQDEATDLAQQINRLKTDKDWLLRINDTLAVRLKHTEDRLSRAFERS